MRQGIEAAGSNLLVVRPAQVKRSAARKTMRGVVTSLRLDDYRAIAALPDRAGGGSGRGRRRSRLKAGAARMAASVLGTAPALARLRNLRLQQRPLLRRGGRRRRRAASRCSARAWRGTLFPAGDAVGQDVRVRGLPFEVIGVLQPKGDRGRTAPTRTATSSSPSAPRCGACSTPRGSPPSSSPSRTARTDARGGGGASADLLRERHRLAPGMRRRLRGAGPGPKLLAMQQEAVQRLTLLTAGPGRRRRCWWAGPGSWRSCSSR